MLLAVNQLYAQTYNIVDTGQSKCYNATQQIAAPGAGDTFYGQDAQINGIQPSYADNGDSTITDLNTGLIWQKMLPGDKYSYTECVAYADTCTLAGYTDWRLPTIKELYSLILFSGKTGMSETSSIAYLDTDYFDFRFGGTVNATERFIDAQYATSTIYKGTTMNGNETMFGVNFVDGRIKGYPTHKDFELKLVRGGNNYGVNDFVDNGNNTILDKATGLMWDQAGSSAGMDWEAALALAQQKNAESYLGYNNWRLPNAKELHSIVDYSRSLSFTNSAACSPLFQVPIITDEKGDANYPFYWTSTTHDDGPLPSKAAYVCFGEALGYMNGNWLDVHGAGAQRSDPKAGDPDDYPTYHGPQGDVNRVFNYVRLVRDVDVTTDIGNRQSQETSLPSHFELSQNYPNPFNPQTVVHYRLPRDSIVRLEVFNLLGAEVATIVNGPQTVGSHSVVFDGSHLSSGVYFYTLTAGHFTQTRKMMLVK